MMLVFHGRLGVCLRSELSAMPQSRRWTNSLKTIAVERLRNFWALDMLGFQVIWMDEIGIWWPKTEGIKQVRHVISYITYTVYTLWNEQEAIDGDAGNRPSLCVPVWVGGFAWPDRMTCVWMLGKGSCETQHFYTKFLWFRARTQSEHLIAWRNPQQARSMAALRKSKKPRVFLWVT